MDKHLENISGDQLNAIISGQPVPNSQAAGAAGATGGSNSTSTGNPTGGGTGSPNPNPNPGATNTPNPTGAAAASGDNNSDANAAAAAAAAAATGGSQQQPPAGSTNSFDFSKWQNGRFKSIEDVEKELAQLPELNKKLNEVQGKIPNYSERVQKAIDFATRYEGLEDEAAVRYLELQRTDVKTLSDQEVRYAAFKLDPKYAGLPEQRRKVLFDGLERQQFGDPADAQNPQTDFQKELQALATDQAKKQISDLQAEFTTAKAAQPSAEEVARKTAEFREIVQKELTSLQGIPFAFSVLNDKGEKVDGALNFKVEPEQLKTIIDAVADPLGAWDQILESRGVFADGPDKPNRQKFAQVLSRLLFSEQIENQIYKQGRDDMFAHLLKLHRNPTNTNNGATGGGGAPNPDGKNLSDMDKVALAVAKAQGLA